MVDASTFVMVHYYYLLGAVEYVAFSFIGIVDMNFDLGKVHIFGAKTEKAVMIEIL